MPWNAGLQGTRLNIAAYPGAPLRVLAGPGTLTAALQREARTLTERAALLLRASLLKRYGSPAVGDAFCASRLDGKGGTTLRTLPQSANVQAILDRFRGNLTNS